MLSFMSLYFPFVILDFIAHLSVMRDHYQSLLYKAERGFGNSVELVSGVVFKAVP